MYSYLNRAESKSSIAPCSSFGILPFYIPKINGLVAKELLSSSEHLFTKWEQMIVRTFFLPYLCSELVV